MLLIFLLFSKLVAKISLEFIFQDGKVFIFFEKEVKSCKDYTSDELKKFFNSLKMENFKKAVFDLFMKLKIKDVFEFKNLCQDIQYYFFQDLKGEFEKSEKFKFLFFQDFCNFFLLSLVSCVLQFLKTYEKLQEYFGIIEEIFDIFLDDFINKREECIKKSTNESDKIFQKDEKLKEDRVLITSDFKDKFQKILKKAEKTQFIETESVARKKFEDKEKEGFLEIKTFYVKQILQALQNKVKTFLDIFKEILTKFKTEEAQENCQTVLEQFYFLLELNKSINETMNEKSIWNEEKITTVLQQTKFFSQQLLDVKKKQEAVQNEQKKQMEGKWEKIKVVINETAATAQEMLSVLEKNSVFFNIISSLLEKLHKLNVIKNCITDEAIQNFEFLVNEIKKSLEIIQKELREQEIENLKENLHNNEKKIRIAIKNQQQTAFENLIKLQKNMEAELLARKFVEDEEKSEFLNITMQNEEAKLRNTVQQEEKSDFKNLINIEIILAKQQGKKGLINQVKNEETKFRAEIKNEQQTAFENLIKLQKNMKRKLLARMMQNEEAKLRNTVQQEEESGWKLIQKFLEDLKNKVNFLIAQVEMRRVVEGLFEANMLFYRRHKTRGIDASYAHREAARQIEHINSAQGRMPYSKQTLSVLMPKPIDCFDLPKNLCEKEIWSGRSFELHSECFRQYLVPGFKIGDFRKENFWVDAFSVIIPKCYWIEGDWLIIQVRYWKGTFCQKAESGETFFGQEHFGKEILTIYFQNGQRITRKVKEELGKIYKCLI